MLKGRDDNIRVANLGVYNMNTDTTFSMNRPIQKLMRFEMHKQHKNDGNENSDFQKSTITKGQLTQKMNNL